MSVCPRAWTTTWQTTLVRLRGRISFQVDWDKIVTVLDPRGRMGWNGVELQGGAGGSVTDRPTDRLYHVWRKSKAKKETTRDAEGFPGYFVSEVVLVSLLAVS